MAGKAKLKQDGKTSAKAGNLVPVAFKASREEIARWKEAAGQVHRTFSSWIRLKLNSAELPGEKVG